MSKQFAMRLVAKRGEAQLTQRELAVRLGVSQAAVDAWERGKSLPRLGRLERLADALSCPIGDLIGARL